MFKFVLVLMLAIVGFAAAQNCVAAPDNLAVCQFNKDATVPSGMDNALADNGIVSFWDYLRGIDALPEYRCAVAYSNYFCSGAYPRCEEGQPLPVCWRSCFEFLSYCMDQLPQASRPDCSPLEYNEPCTYRTDSDLDLWYSDSASQLTAGVSVTLLAVAALLL